MAAGDRAGQRFGQYELRRLLGVGGMGEVYEAYDTVRERTVAIKLLDVELAKSPTYVERFRRESHTAARLQEPHVIPVHDWGEVDGVLFIDMRLVAGRDLKAYLSAEGPMPPQHSVGVVEQIGAALDAAHAIGLVHRDIKPANILLTGELFAYLVDFGIAHAESDVQLTSMGSAIGSFAYMAPERFEHDTAVSASADIYALGCVLYESLTGEIPFKTDSNLATIRAHMMAPPPRPSVRTGVPAGFDQVIATAMAKEPARRYASAGQLARAARAALLPADSQVTRTSVGPAMVVPPAAQTFPPRYPQTSGPVDLRDQFSGRVGHASGPVAYLDHSAGQAGYGGHPSGPVDYQASQPTRFGIPITPQREHPSAPLPLPPPQRNTLPMVVGALIAVVLLLGGILGWLLLSGKDNGGTGTPVTASGIQTTSNPTASGNTTSAVTTVRTTAALSPLIGSVSGTDAQGFAGNPRCDADNPAYAIGRTAASRVLICRTGVGRYYYKGVRISDGAGIELDDPVPDGSGGFSVTNPADGTRYRITAAALTIAKGGTVLANETMIEYAHR
ncbi:protein kinase [Nocardia sp. SYP-A9097]|uniref:serine/threonine-protein kinase n=1 Tax=Nocardia sp. SYP-A9097 TaxID=2663237 RepID=UPI0013209FD0|nr:serine/threonine-protein kinase [Nocardia sp. SYP-A9097]MRH87033.1 protein kinase [Nocardia sp. SYP-A9097]